MATTAVGAATAPDSGTARLSWVPLAIGLAVLYLPTFYDLNRTLWKDDDYAHGPIILLAALWMFWRERAALTSAPQRADGLAGFTVLAFGLLCYAVGRSQAVIALEVSSLLPVAAGSVLAVYGRAALRRLWFPLVFLAFLVPLPGVIVNPLTGVLREYVSVIAETVLHRVDYPIARTGVILTIGPYQLLVAVACSGINSMFSLSALGLLYLYLMRYRNPWRKAALLASILPIAFAANLLRVIVLVLVTYHYGAAAGQGFIHDFSGVALFVSGLVLLLAMDAVAGKVRALQEPGR
jgi:exosortase B